jgi:alpha-tubulin suppressor-like RCC1 family protein
MPRIGLSSRLAQSGLSVIMVAATIAAVTLNGSPAQAAAGRSHLWAWGNGASGVPEDAAEPVPVHGLGPGAVKQVVTTINGHGLGLLSDGTLYSWGGEPLGNGGTASSKTPVQVTTLSGVTAIAATTQFTGFSQDDTLYALLSDGTVWAWGNGSDGQLGNGTTAESDTPVQVTGLTGVTKIVAAADTAYALTRNGRVWAWGAGTEGQLGNGSTANSDVPVEVNVADRVIQVASQCGAAYALTGGRRVFSWGDNTYGQLGDGTRTSSASPVLVRRVSHASTVIAGCVDAYAIIGGTGSVMSWGQGTQGQMGDGHTAMRLYPVAVEGLTGISSVSIGYQTTYAVASDGTLWAWGYGRQGQLGDGVRDNSSVPVKVINITVPVTAVVSGQYYASGQETVVARGSDGSLWSWGYCGFNACGGGGSYAEPARIPRIPPVTNVFGDSFGAV